MVGERLPPAQRRGALTGMHKLVALAAVLHLAGSLIAVTLSNPNTLDYSPAAEAWKRVLGFPLITIHDAIFGAEDGALAAFWPSGMVLRQLFWIGGNSFLWGAGIYYAVRGVLRRLRGSP